MLDLKTLKKIWKKAPKPRFSESTGLKTLILFGVLGLIGLWIALMDLHPDLSHMDVTMLSGVKHGNYHELVEALSKEAKDGGGVVNNVPSNGSIDNVERLLRASDSCDVQFGLSLDGIVPATKKLELIGRLPKSDSVFFLGKNADQITTFRQLKGKRIGIGPKGSGTAKLGHRIFESDDFKDALKVTLVNHTFNAQLALLRSGKLELAMFVMDEDAPMIRHAVRGIVPDGDKLVEVQEQRLQIASFRHSDVIARRFRQINTGRIGTGQYNPVELLPPTDKRVLRIDTLVLGNKCAARTTIYGLLKMLTAVYPDFLIHNKENPNTTGFQLSNASKTFFENDGPDLVGEYFPLLVDVMPTSNWLHIFLGISILFNITAYWHRFRLWRVDANRVKAELMLPMIFGVGAVYTDVDDMEPSDQFRTQEKRDLLDAIIARMAKLAQRCHKQSLSVLVPMGAEMAYRYQEKLMYQTLEALKKFRSALGEEVVA